MDNRITQGEFDFGKCVSDGYLEKKEGFIFAILREECPQGRIFFKTTKGNRRKQFKVVSGDGHIYQLNFTDDFLFYRDLKELKHALAYNLDYMKRVKTDSCALFTRSSVRIKDY